MTFVAIGALMVNNFLMVSGQYNGIMSDYELEFSKSNCSNCCA